MDYQPNFSRETKLQWAGSRETISTPVEAEFFLDIPPQKQTQDCTATVISRPSLAAFF
jgi:hypothetical protein